MFGIDQTRLLANLQIMREGLCSYMPATERCDCKFIWDDKRFSKGRSEQGPGCPEIGQCIAMLAELTPQEFDALRERSQINKRSAGDSKGDQLF